MFVTSRETRSIAGRSGRDRLLQRERSGGITEKLELLAGDSEDSLFNVALESRSGAGRAHQLAVEAGNIHLKHGRDF